MQWDNCCCYRQHHAQYLDVVVAREVFLLADHDALFEKKYNQTQPTTGTEATGCRFPALAAVHKGPMSSSHCVAVRTSDVDSFHFSVPCTFSRFLPKGFG